MDSNRLFTAAECEQIVYNVLCYANVEEKRRDMVKWEAGKIFDRYLNGNVKYFDNYKDANIAKFAEAIIEISEDDEEDEDEVDNEDNKDDDNEDYNEYKTNKGKKREKDIKLLRLEDKKSTKEEAEVVKEISLSSSKEPPTLDYICINSNLFNKKFPFKINCLKSILTTYNRVRYELSSIKKILNPKSMVALVIDTTNLHMVENDCFSQRLQTRGYLCGMEYNDTFYLLKNVINSIPKNIKIVIICMCDIGEVGQKFYNVRSEVEKRLNKYKERISDTLVLTHVDDIFISCDTRLNRLQRFVKQAS